MEKQKHVITSAGVKMPRIIYGTAWKKDRTADLVVKAVLAGFRGIDTACQPKHYDEALVGAALNRLKDHGIERDAFQNRCHMINIPLLRCRWPNPLKYRKETCKQNMWILSYFIHQ